MSALSYTPESVHLLIRIKPKKKHFDEVLRLAYETISPTHKEEGCLEYRLFHEENSIVIMGKWKNTMALQMHLLLHFHLHLFENILPGLCKKIDLRSYKETEPPITSLSIL